jgi:hypothetical protein
MNNIDSLQYLVKELATNCGYGNDSEIECWMGTSVDTYEIGIYTRLSLPRQTQLLGNKAIVDELVKQIQDPIKNSMLVENLTSELTEKIKELESHVALLKSEVRQLEPFKVHYDLQYKMEHGK